MKSFTHTQRALLQLLGKALFGAQITIESAYWRDIYQEAEAHKVFPMVFDASKQYLIDEELKEQAAKRARHNLAVTVNLNYAHAQLGRLMAKADIPYVVFKGLASARYYPKPELRVSGDVDFYVQPKDFERCEAVLRKSGCDCAQEEGKHVSFQKSGVTLELHRTFNGIPKSAIGERIQTEVFGDLVQTAVVYDEGQGSVNMPDTFHHGMILLLHTLSHMTAEGIGLRHLCDWAVFQASLDNEAFVALFEEKLKQYGLWNFAQILSLCAVRYLGAPYRAWQGEAEDAVLQALMQDILAAGNFGEKDRDRQAQTKYIADRQAGTVGTEPPLKQLHQTLAKKAALQHKSKAAVAMDYLKNIITGKRKPDTKKTLDAAARRKAVYAAFHLFEPEQ